MSERLAVFDVDSTLYDGNLGMELLSHMIAREVFHEELGRQISDWYKKYKSGEVKKNLAVDKIYEIFAQGMSGNTVEEVNALAQEAWGIAAYKLHGFAGPLVRQLQERDIRVILLSGSPIEMINILGRHLGIEERDMIGGTLEIKDGKYTGAIDFYPAGPEEKVSAFEKYKLENGLPNAVLLVALGDSGRDFGILSMATLPFIFEPEEKIRDEALERGYNLVDNGNILTIITEAIDSK